MKPKVTKTLVAGAVMAVFGLASTCASAVTFPDFDFDPTGAALSFTADKITGNYVEVITFDGLGNFNLSLKWQAGQFVADDGTNPVFGTGLNTDYALYALFQGKGTVSLGSPVSFMLSNAPGDSSLQFYYDDNPDTTFTAPATGNLPWTANNTGDDFLLGSGVAIFGAGTLNPTCPGGINCGSFGQTTSLALTAAGKQVFTAPVPFFNVTFESGQFNNFAVTGTQTINGSLDVVFGSIPEPSTVALLGVGLVGFGLRLGKRKES